MEISWNFQTIQHRYTVEPRFNEVAGDRPNLLLNVGFVISKNSI